MQIIFYHYIINQDENSIIYKFLEIQKQSPVRGDWFSTVQSNMKFIKFTMTDFELKHTKKSKLKQILNENISKKAFEYLQSKRGTKGNKIKYSKLEMSSYLLPNDYNLTIEDKRQMFSIKNNMINIFSNFPSKKLPKYCRAGCEIIESNEHIYTCEKLNITHTNIEYDQIYNGELNKQIQVYLIMKENMKRRENIVVPSDLCDPLISQ